MYRGLRLVSRKERACSYVVTNDRPQRLLACAHTHTTHPTHPDPNLRNNDHKRFDVVCLVCLLCTMKLSLK